MISFFEEFVFLLQTLNVVSGLNIGQVVVFHFICKKLIMHGEGILLNVNLTEYSSGLNEFLLDNFLALSGLVKGGIQVLEVSIILIDVFFEMEDFSFVDANLLLFLLEVGLIVVRLLILPDGNEDGGVALLIFVDVEVVVLGFGAVCAVVEGHEEVVCDVVIVGDWGN